VCIEAVASPGFGAGKGTKRHRNNVSHTRKIAQNRRQIYTVLPKKIRYTLFILFTKMRNKLILIAVVRKILKTFDVRDCLHTFIAPERGRKK